MIWLVEASQKQTVKTDGSFKSSAKSFSRFLDGSRLQTVWCGRFERRKIKITSGSFPSLLFPGWSQRGGATVFWGWLSLEGTFVYTRERAQRGDSHQVCPLPRPERPVAGAVCPCRAQHFPEQVYIGHVKNLVVFIYCWRSFKGQTCCMWLPIVDV